MAATNLNPRDMVGRIYEVNRYALLHTKYRRCGLHGFTQISFLKVFPHYKSMEANDPQGVVNLDPRGMVDRIWTPGAWLTGFVKGTARHYYILHIYTVALMSRLKIRRCLKFFPVIRLGYPGA